MSDEHHFLLQRVQPAMVGLIDGSLSTLAPIFSVALISHKPIYAFVAGLALRIVLGATDERIVREHWHGDPATLDRVLRVVRFGGRRPPPTLP